ncbi:MAG: hypothetical protein WAQ53_12875 [Thiofilum sp.]|uniref:hypothetical protein n=1 Tax=Thiofilum sp. TaxID=2212733 RepID=UPI0025DB6BF4|nr:hypothetical protein [Thiofilum sp.]MBK8453898.1 hypothetical protein [Thiofilum sp.]
MAFIDTFIEWAWARHHNILSWYIRPLFLLPFCYFAYRRSGLGIFITVLALATSMFWFPAPKTVSTEVLSALQAEKEYLLGSWTIWKLLLALLVPASFIALAAAFWKRSYMLGLLVINAMVLIKILWTLVIFDKHAALAHLVPAIVGLSVVNLGVLYWLKRHRL